MSDYDNTNSGVLFQPFNDQKLAGQGRLNIDGVDHKVCMVMEPLKKGGNPELVMYMRLGPLFKNDKGENANAPDRSGPVDPFPNKRIAAWLKEKDGRKFYSLAISDKLGGSGGSSGASDAFNPEGTGPAIADDEIPF